jgi:hypothetical protein
MRLIPPEAVTNEVLGKTVVNACPAPNAWSISDFRSGGGVRWSSLRGSRTACFIEGRPNARASGAGHLTAGYTN